MAISKIDVNTLLPAFTPPTIDPSKLKMIKANSPLAPNTLNLSGIASNIGGVAQGLSGIYNAFNTAQGLKDTSSLESSIANRGSGLNYYTDFSSLLNDWSYDNPLSYASMADVRNAGATGKGILSGIASGSSAGSAFGPIGSLVGGAVGGIGGLIGGIFGKGKARKKLNQLNDQVAKANQLVQDNFLNNVYNIDSMNDDRLEASFFAEGGYKPSNALREYIKSKEAFVPYVYDDRGGAKRRWDANNKVANNSRATIGYGFTDQALINHYLSSGKEMSRAEADIQLEKELHKRINEVSSLPNFHKLPQHQQDALMALDYAVGFGNVKKFKELHTALESGNTEAIAGALYNYTRGVNDPKTGKGIKKAWESLGHMAKYGEYKNPYTGKAMTNAGSPYRDFGYDASKHYLIEHDSPLIQEQRAQAEQVTRKNQVLKPLVDWDALTKISDLHSFEFAEGGYTEFNEGGTHEENPLNGIQFGINPETQEPLKAEEGEVKVGDYIFSNKIKPDVATLKSLGLPQNKEVSYADIAKNLKKKLDKRPNDEIMQRYYEQSIDRLKNAQESTKRLREKAKENMIVQASQELGVTPVAGEDTNLFADGGYTDKQLEQLKVIGSRKKFKNTIDDLFFKGIVPPTSNLDVTGLSRYIQYNVTPYFLTPPTTSDTTVPTTAPTPTPINKTQTNNPFWSKFRNFDSANLRYAPIVQSGLNVFTDLIGATNNDDFSTANALESEYRKTFTPVQANLISSEMGYNPFDTDYAINRLQSQGAATRQAITNNGGGNRATINAGLLVSDRNLLEAVGNEMIKAQEFNNQQKRQVLDFNRQKDIFNAQQLTQNQQMNHAINQARIQGIERAGLMREQEKAINAENRSINRNVFTEMLGQLGREIQDRRFANALMQYQIKDNKIKYGK